MSDFLSIPPVTILIRPKRNIGGITATVTLEEISTDTMEITKHPVQQGANITDHSYKNPAALSIRALWNDSKKPVAEIYDDLLALQATRIPFTVITGKRAYRNMLFASLGQTTDQSSEKCLSIICTLEQIIVVGVEVTSVPPRERQATPATTGATENAGTKAPQKSALAIAVNPNGTFTQATGSTPQLLPPPPGL